MPRLVMRLDGLPSKALYGEIVECTLEITNVGRERAASATLAVSHPAFFTTAEAQGVGQPPPEPPQAEAAEAAAGEASREQERQQQRQQERQTGGEEARETGGEASRHIARGRWEDRRYSPEVELDPYFINVRLSEDGGGLEPGGVVKVRVWWRACWPGMHKFRLLLCYRYQPLNSLNTCYEALIYQIYEGLRGVNRWCHEGVLIGGALVVQARWTERGGGVGHGLSHVPGRGGGACASVGAYGGARAYIGSRHQQAHASAARR
jgi:hypothetical protein